MTRSSLALRLTPTSREDLLELAPADRRTQVDTFVGASSSVSELAKQFLGAVGG